MSLIIPKAARKSSFWSNDTHTLAFIYPRCHTTPFNENFVLHHNLKTKNAAGRGGCSMLAIYNMLRLKLLKAKKQKQF